MLRKKISKWDIIPKLEKFCGTCSHQNIAFLLKRRSNIFKRNRFTVSSQIKNVKEKRIKSAKETA